MLSYRLRLAWISLRRTPVVSLLLVGGITLGVGVAIAAVTVDYALSRDPLPGRSDSLFYVRLDAWDPLREAPHPGGIPTQITWRDMQGIAGSKIPSRVSATFKSRQFVSAPGRPEIRPEALDLRLVESGFFEMFGAPFARGAGWDRAADRDAEQVAVIGHELAQRLFGGADAAIGQAIRVGSSDLAVVGVLERWRPQFKVYDPTQNPFAAIEEVFAPLSLTPGLELRSSGNRDGWASVECEGFAACLEVSESVFLQYWVELPDAAAARDYAAFLDAYAAEQKRIGRFQRPLRTELTGMRELFEDLGLRPPQVRAISAISLLFMVVCAVNLIGLFLGKFLGRASIVGVRRALGASRREIFAQHLVEATLVGVGGALGGVALGALLLAGVRRGIAPIIGDPSLFQLDAAMALTALGLATVAALLAGSYPAWRICRIQPAHHLKLQ